MLEQAVHFVVRCDCCDREAAPPAQSSPMALVLAAKAGYEELPGGQFCPQCLESTYTLTAPTFSLPLAPGATTSGRTPA
jgi:hypothetical protein